ncbi:MAG: hypothetical protein MJ252_11475 [archaeon]|nr:hypothetical protein [archaeon]
MDKNNTVIKKQSKNNILINLIDIELGTVFCKNALDLYFSYIEFKVSMCINWKDKNHLYIGLVDKSKFNPEDLIAMNWKTAPSIYFWDVWNLTLYKNNEFGNTEGTASNYGCSCTGFDVLIGIKYDFKTRTVSFYKNSINLGIAFKNVPSGLTPAIDLGFESGTVQIMNNQKLQEKTFL